MEMKALITGIFLLLTIYAGAQTLSEDQKIQNLIAYVEGLDKAVFIRNGEEYNPKQAAKFFREKWKRKSDKVKTAKDFILHCASVSSTTGKPYQVRLSDGKTVNTQELLVKQLIVIEQACAK